MKGWESSSSGYAAVWATENTREAIWDAMKRNPRWPAFDEVRFGIKMAPEVTRVLQERAYTSPIWYTP